MKDINQQININLNDAENVTCDDCGGDVFSPAFFIKRLSALMSPTAKETLIPIQVFKCDNCAHVNELFLQGPTN